RPENGSSAPPISRPWPLPAKACSRPCAASARRYSRHCPEYFSVVNLPNAITIGRIVASPLVGWLPLTPSVSYRVWAFALFVILGREVAMTVFREMAANRGVVISAIGSAKWKTGFQMVWVGSAFFWFAAATMAHDSSWADTGFWHFLRNFNGVVGVGCMIGAV